MSATPLVLVGGGEHARVVAEAARSLGGAFDLIGFVDPSPCEETVRRLGLKRLGGDDGLSLLKAKRVLGVGAIGVSTVRQDLVRRLPEGEWATIVHAHAWVSPTATIGVGSVIMAGAIVQTGARIGAHCVVNTGAVIEHDVELGDFAQIGPGAKLGGGARIGTSSYVGLGACVRDHIRIGSRVLIGMGAVVVGDVPDNETMTGVPAKATAK